MCITSKASKTYYVVTLWAVGLYKNRTSSSCGITFVHSRKSWSSRFRVVAVVGENNTLVNESSEQVISVERIQKVLTF